MERGNLFSVPADNSMSYQTNYTNLNCLENVDE